MTQRALHLGLDVGATLAKLATRREGEPAQLEFLPSADLTAVSERVLEAGASRIGLTGGGAARLAEMLPGGAHRVGEFEAWGSGATSLLAEDASGAAPEPGERFLLVSLGTGTSVLLVDGRTVSRVGGTALGGGTVVGLGTALTGAGFEELCLLAHKGSPRGVDLRVSDIYGPDEIPLAGDLTAANFGRLARDLTNGSGSGSAGSTEASRRARPEDLAAGVMRLVGENVALICAGLMAATQTAKIVFGGTTVRGNPCLVEVLDEVTTLCGRRACFLHNGEFAGALGALELSLTDP